MITGQLIIEVVARHYCIPQRKLLERRRGYAEWERQLAMLVCHKMASPHLTYEQIGTLFGYGGYLASRASSAWHCIHRAKLRLLSQPAYIGHAIAIGDRLQRYIEAQEEISKLERAAEQEQKQRERAEMVRKVFARAKERMEAA